MALPWPDVTGPQYSPPPAGDGLSAARARAAELGVPLSDYVRDQLRRTRGEQAWERALKEAGQADRAASRARWEALAAAALADLGDPARPGSAPR